MQSKLLAKKLTAIVAVLALLATLTVGLIPASAEQTSYRFEVVQDYEGENNGSWAHGHYYDPSTKKPTTNVTEDVTGQTALSGNTSFFTRLKKVNSQFYPGSDHLVANAATMAHSVSEPTGVFFRMKVNRNKNTIMYLSTVGAASAEYDYAGYYESNYSLMNPSINTACVDARYYDLSGNDVTLNNNGRVVPANFDGYVFVPFDVSSKTLEGLTILYAEPNDGNNDDIASQNSAAHWFGAKNNLSPTLVGFDNVGVYAAASADDCKAIIAAVEGGASSGSGGNTPDPNPGGGNDPGSTPAGDAVLFQSYETEAERANAAAAGTVVVSGDGDKITNRYSTAKTLQGAYSRELYFTGNNYGGDYLVTEAPASTLATTTGIFVRMKVNTVKDTVFTLLPTEDKDNELNWPNQVGAKAVRYYNLSGELVSTSECMLPAGFDGYAFIPSGEVTGQAVAAMLLPYWYGQTYGDVTNATHWWVAGPNDGVPTILFDDIGYYYVANDTAADYKVVVDKLVATATPGVGGNTPPPNPGGGNVTAAYEIIQDYEGENPNGTKWGHAGHIDVDSNQTPITIDPVTAQNILSGSNSFFTQITRVGNSGSDFLIADAADMTCTLTNPTGIFFRMKTNRNADTTMYLSTIGAASGAHAWGANSEAAYSLMNWSHNNACLDAKYYALDGTDKTVNGDGRVIPANFDGYVFIPFNVSSKTLEGLTIMYAQNWALTGSYSGTIAQWYNGDPATVVGFDNIGYYTAGTAADYKTIIDAVEAEAGPGVGTTTPPLTHDATLFQSYESEGERTNAAQVGAHVGVPDSWMITNRYVTGSPLCGSYSRELYWDGEVGSGADYLVMTAPASTLETTTGIYIRIKTNSTAVTPLTLLTTTDTDGTISDWPAQNALAAKYYNLDGELVLTNNSVCPAGFDGYAFIPCGDVEGQAIAAMLTATWYGNAYGGVETTAWWNAGPDGGRANLLIDDIGYYYTADDSTSTYKSVVEKLIAGVGPSTGGGTGGGNTPTPPPQEPSYGFEVIQNYEGENTNGGLWGHAGYVNGDANQLPATKDPDVAQAPLCGNGSFFTQMMDVNAGSDFLVADAYTMQYTLENPTGLFFRLRTNREEKTTMFLSTIGASTPAQQWCGNNNVKYSLMDFNCNNACINAKYYGLDGTDLTVDGDGRVIPANFDGYVFIPFNTATKTLEGLTIMYAQAWALQGSYSGSIAHWYTPEKATVVGFDNIGFYSVSGNVTAAAYADIIRRVEAGEGYTANPNPNPPAINPGAPDAPGEELGKDDPNSGTYKYEVLNTYETEEEQANVGPHMYADGYFSQTSSIGGDYSLRVDNAGVDAVNVALLTEAPKPTVENANTIFFRFKANNAAGGDLCMSSGTPILGYDEWTGDFTLVWKDVHYGRLVFVWKDGRVVTSDSIVPANFDGYIFAILNDTLNERYEKGFLRGIRAIFPKWWAGFNWSGTTQVFDNVGYCSISDTDNAALFRNMANELFAKYPVSENAGGGSVPLMRKYMTYEDDLDPTEANNATYFQKPYLYINTEMPIAVKWSVVSGQAEFTYLQDPNDATLEKHGVMITFGSTGKVVVRAELVGDPEQYAEYTFTVRKDASRLDDMVFEAGMIIDYTTGELYEALSKVLAEAYELLMKDDATQLEYNTLEEMIRKLLEVYENGGELTDDIFGDEPTDDTVVPPADIPADDTPDVPTDDTTNVPESSSPDTGERSLVIPVLMLAVVSCIAILALRKKGEVF